MSSEKSTKFRRSYSEKPNIRYRTKQFILKSINYKDFILEDRVFKYRVKWKSSFYTAEEYNAKETQNFLDYFQYDIEDEIETQGGVKVVWKDSYIPISDIISP